MMMIWLECYCYCVTDKMYVVCTGLRSQVTGESAVIPIPIVICLLVVSGKVGAHTHTHTRDTETDRQLR
jgi:hypothetical protein